MMLKDFMLISERPVDSDNQLIRESGKIVRSPEGIIVERNSNVACSILGSYIKGKIKTPGFWRICLLFNHNRRDEKEYVISGGVVSIYCEFNYNEYIKLSGIYRGEYLLKFIIANVIRVFDHFGIQKDILEHALIDLSSSSFEFEFRGKNVKSPFDKRTAFIEVIQKLDFSEVYLVVKSGVNICAKQKIAIDETSQFQFQIHFGDLSWLDEFHIKLMRADNKEFLFNISA